MTSNFIKLIRASKWGFYESISTRLFGIVFNIFLVWIASPDELGFVASFIVLHSIFSVIQNFGVYDFLIYEQNFRKYYPSCYFITTSAGILFTIVLIIYFTFFRNFENTDQYFLSILYSSSLLPATFITIPKSLIYVQNKFKLIYRIKITGFLIDRLTTLILLFFGFSILSFGIGLLLSTFYILIAYNLHASLRIIYSFNHLNYILDKIKYTFSTSVSQTFSRNIDYILISFVSTEALGIYFMAFTLVSQIAVLFSNSINPNLTAAINRIKQNKIKNDIKIYLSYLIRYGFFFAFLTGFLFEPFIYEFFPSKWHTTISYIQILMFGVGFQLSTNIWISLLKSLGLFKQLLIISLISNVTFLILGLSLVQFYDSFGIALAFSLNAILISIVSLNYSLKKWKLDYYETTFSLLKYFAFTLISFTPNFVIFSLVENNYLKASSVILSLLMYKFFYRNFLNDLKILNIK